MRTALERSCTAVLNAMNGECSARHAIATITGMAGIAARLLRPCRTVGMSYAGKKFPVRSSSGNIRPITRLGNLLLEANIAENAIIEKWNELQAN